MTDRGGSPRRGEEPQLHGSPRMRAPPPWLLGPILLLASACAGRVDEPLPEPAAGGPRECWTDDDCVIARDVAGCCAGCAGVVSREVADFEQCLVEVGQDAPAACYDVGCSAQPACGDWCLEPVGAACARGQCVALFDCGEANTAPIGTVCRD